MADQIITTKEFTGLRAVDDRKGKRIGKVRRFVFHPKERRCIGFLVKRPDAALMFHRKDLFVALDGFTLQDGQVVVSSDPSATDKGAVKALGVDWDSCVVWVGMPLFTESGQDLGYIDVVSFDRRTGAVASLTTENGAANNAILGTRTIPGKFVRGFKRGVGAALAPVGSYQGEDADESTLFGAIIVADEAADLPVEGGVAAAAGKATAVAANKVKTGADKAKKVADEKLERAKPAAQEAARKTGEAAQAGAFAAGRQLGRASGMFAAFKEEYDKAVRGEDEDRG